MKTLNTNRQFLQLLSATEISNLTVVVKEEVAKVSAKQQFSAADLWKIRNMRRTPSVRRGLYF